MPFSGSMRPTKRMTRSPSFSPSLWRATSFSIGVNSSRSTPHGTTAMRSASAPYSAVSRCFSCALATTMRSALVAMRRSASMRDAGSCSVARARFFTSPSVWNIATCGTPQRCGEAASPTTPDIQ